MSVGVPAGVSLRHDPDFERLKAELHKLESPSGEPVDWNHVVSLSRKILEDKSKDLLVSSYLGRGLLEIEGFSGLSKGLACLEGIVSAFWPTLHPAETRMRARINALTWFAEKAGSAVARREPKPGEADILRTCEEQVIAIETVLEQKMGPDGPDLNPLRRPIQEHLRRLSVAEATGKTEAEPRHIAPEAETPAGTAGQVEPINTSGDAKRLLHNSISTLKRVISFTRNQDPASPLPYRLIRALVWCQIDLLPPADSGRSRIPPPPTHLRAHCQSMIEESSWTGLLNQIEPRVADFPFWLDLHRMSEQALSGLGAEYTKARDAVRAEVVTLLSRLPELLEYQFADGTPFGDEATRKWVSTTLFPAEDVESAEVATSDDRAEFLNDLRKESRNLMQGEKQEDAIRLVQQAMRCASTQRQKFVVQLELARLCIEANQVRVALAHLEMLDEQIERYSLDLWEPDLSLEVLYLYWRTLNDAVRASKQPAPEMSARTDSVHSRVCKLDALAGLSLAKKKEAGGARKPIYLR